MKTKETVVHYFMQEIRESLGLWFWMTVFVGMVCILLDCGTDIVFAFISPSTSSVYSYIGIYFPCGFYGAFVFAPLMALPYSLSYYRDYQAGIVRAVAARTGTAAYCMGKVLAAFASSFLAGAGSIAVWVAGLHCLMPLAREDTAVGLGGISFINLIASGKYVEYFLIFIFLMGLWCGIYGVIVLCASAYAMNAYVCIAGAVVGTYAVTVLLNVLNVGAAYRPSSWFKCSLTPFTDGETFGCCLTVTLLAVTALGAVFQRKVKLRLKNE